jgi:hypothetical protein
VLRRLGDDLSASPRAARISGEAERWEALVESIASNIELEEALERVRERPATVASVSEEVSSLEAQPIPSAAHEPED